MIEIRLLKNGEEEEFIKLKLESLKVASKYLIENPNYNPTVDSVKKQINSSPPEMVVYVLKYNNKMFGIIQASLGINLYRTHHATLHSLFVSKKIYKLAKLNNNISVPFGTMLMSDSILHLRNIGIEIITATSFSDNALMSNIFHSLNFTQTHNDPYFVKFTNQAYRGVSFWYLETSKLKIPYAKSKNG